MPTHRPHSRAAPTTITITQYSCSTPLSASASTPTVLKPMLLTSFGTVVVIMRVVASVKFDVDVVAVAFVEDGAHCDVADAAVVNTPAPDVVVVVTFSGGDAVDTLSVAATVANFVDVVAANDAAIFVAPLLKVGDDDAIIVLGIPVITSTVAVVIVVVAVGVVGVLLVTAVVVVVFVVAVVAAVVVVVVVGSVVRSGSGVGNGDGIGADAEDGVGNSIGDGPGVGNDVGKGVSDNVRQ
jgi:hypothetical protein